MLTNNERRAVAQQLTEAYDTYRDLPLRTVCKKAGLFVRKQFDDEFGGCLEGNPIEVPARAPRDGKELVFWHEFCHWLLREVLEYPRRIGHQGFLQQGEETYWIHERLCQAFANLMLLYRRNLATFTAEEVEALLFEDTGAIGYAEVIRASQRRISKQYEIARASGRNLDLTNIEAMLPWLERAIYNAAFQPLLPTSFLDCHQTPWVSYVDERRDLLVNERHWHKISWKTVWPKERRLFAWMKNIEQASKQLTLFEEAALHDQLRLQKELKRLDRAVSKLQKT